MAGVLPAWRWAAMVGVSYEGPPGELVPQEIKAEASGGIQAAALVLFVLVTGGSLRPALIQGKGNQMPRLDEGVTRSHCRMEDTVSATFGECFLPQWLTDVCGDE